MKKLKLLSGFETDCSVSETNGRMTQHCWKGGVCDSVAVRTAGAGEELIPKETFILSMGLIFKALKILLPADTGCDSGNSRRLFPCDTPNAETRFAPS